MLKTAVLAPMPRARVRIATAAKAGDPRPITHLGDRPVWIAAGIAHQTVVGSSTQTVVAGAALRLPSDDDAVAYLNAIDMRSHFDDGADAAMTRDHRLCGIPRTETLRRCRVADLSGLGANDDLTRRDRQQLERLHRGARREANVGTERLAAPARRRSS